MSRLACRTFVPIALFATGSKPGATAQWPISSPPNLTLLSRQNDGFFPYGRVFDTIDERSEVAAQRPRDMPVWGEALQASGDSLGAEGELLADDRILAPTRYLERLQAKRLLFGGRGSKPDCSLSYLDAWPGTRTCL